MIHVCYVIVYLLRGFCDLHKKIEYFLGFVEISPVRTSIPRVPVTILKIVQIIRDIYMFLDIILNVMCNYCFAISNKSVQFRVSRR